MEYFEYAYLLHVAHFIREKDLEAKKDGEEFQASNIFFPLKNGGEAQARIIEDAIPGKLLLVLKIRYSEDPDTEAKQFFHGKYEKLPKTSIYVSTEIPDPPLKPP